MLIKIKNSTILKNIFLKSPTVVNHPKQLYAFSSHIILSKERHEELILAELNDLSMRPTSSLRLSDIHYKLNKDESIQYVHNELSIRFATRVKQLQKLPHNNADELVQNVTNIYYESFTQLRNANLQQSTQFHTILTNLKKRHENIVPMLVSGVRNLMKQYPNELTNQCVDDFLNTFFLSRIGTEMLTSNYLSPCGIVDKHCDVILVLKRAAEDAQKLCNHHYSVCPQIMIWNLVAQRLAYVPQYLYYILFELLKNAMRAVIENSELGGPHKFLPLDQFSVHRSHFYEGHTSFQPDYSHNTINPSGEPHNASSATHSTSQPYLSETLPPINIVLSGDDQEVSIKLSDRGGGIPRSVQNQIWSYMYTTARPVAVRIPIFHHEEDGEIINSVTHTVGSLDTEYFIRAASSIENKSPLAGFGCGLPLSRLYAHYLGGSLQIVSMPNYGTDLYLFLKRVGDA